MKSVKRMLTWLLSVVMVLTAVAAVPALANDGTEATGTYMTTGDVNLRSGAGMSNKIVVTVPAKAKVTVTNTSNKIWYKATYKSKKGKTYKGYISKKYLKKVKEKKKAKKGTEYITTGAVYMRSKASKGSKALTVVPAKSTVTVTDTSTGKWYKSTYKTKKGKVYKGYISNKYLKKKNAAKGKKYKAKCAVYLRKKATKASEAVATIPAKASVTVTDTSNKNWFKATYKSKKGKVYKGFISSKYLVKA